MEFTRLLFAIILLIYSDDHTDQTLPVITIESLNEVQIDNSGNDCFGKEIGILNPTVGILNYDSAVSKYMISIHVQGTIDSQIVLVDCLNSFEGSLLKKVQISGIVAQSGLNLQSPIAGVKFFSFKPLAK